MHSSLSSAAAIRNLIVFAIVALAAGWLGRGLDVAVGSPASEGLGQLVWIAAPALTGLLLRGFGGEGWTDAGLRPSFGRNGRWYLFAILCAPVSLLLTILLGMAFGIMQVTLPDAGNLLRLVSLALAPAFVKNIAEEFAWRGYLTPRFSVAGVPDALNHVLTGLVWAAWHVPYYLFFLDRATFAAISPHGLPVFFVTMFIGVVVLAFVYGELRLVTGTMLLSGKVAMAFGAADLLASPMPGSLMSIALNVAIWLWLRRHRQAMARR